jgi:hypothetical protein
MKIDKHPQRIFVRVPENLKRRFEEKATASGQSMSERIRFLMEKDARKP